jgi:hypothetical protein
MEWARDIGLNWRVVRCWFRCLLSLRSPPQPSLPPKLLPPPLRVCTCFLLALGARRCPPLVTLRCLCLCCLCLRSRLRSCLRLCCLRSRFVAGGSASSSSTVDPALHALLSAGLPAQVSAVTGHSQQLEGTQLKLLKSLVSQAFTELNATLKLDEDSDETADPTASALKQVWCSRLHRPPPRPAAALCVA